MIGKWKVMDYGKFVFMSGGILDSENDAINRASELLSKPITSNLHILRKTSDSRAYYLIYGYDLPDDMNDSFDAWIEKDSKDAYYRYDEDNSRLNNVVSRFSAEKWNNAFINAVIVYLLVLISTTVTLIVNLSSVPLSGITVGKTITNTLPNIFVLLSLLSSVGLLVLSKRNKFMQNVFNNCHHFMAYDGDVFVIDKKALKNKNFDSNRTIRKLNRRLKKRLSNNRFKITDSKKHIIVSMPNSAKSNRNTDTLDCSMDEITAFAMVDDGKMDSVDISAYEHDTAESEVSVSDEDKARRLISEIRAKELAALNSSDISDNLEKQLRGIGRLRVYAGARYRAMSAFTDKLMIVSRQLDELGSSNASIDDAMKDLNDAIAIKSSIR